MVTLKELIFDKGLTVSELARMLDVQPSSIYIWNKEGIYETNPHYSALKKIIPEIESKGKGKHITRKKPVEPLDLDSLPEVTLPSISSDRPVKTRRDYPKVIIRQRRDEDGTHRKNGVNKT